jgi:hypothetical protein
MSKNVGGIDRIIRVVIGLALIAWALTGTSSAAVWGWGRDCSPDNRPDWLVPSLCYFGHEQLQD